MLFIDRPQTNPYFNIAAEEYLLKTLRDECFMIWRNEPSVVVGKHQNAMAEINFEVIRKLDLPVVRRISGGGTVYHDLGNVNFTFIKTGDKEHLVNFRSVMQPIIDALRVMGIPAEFSGKSEIRVNGLKVSGNSEHIYRNKILHHGTLLYSANLSRLSVVLTQNSRKHLDKAVKSVPSDVVNISDLLKNPPNVNGFMEKISEYVKSTIGPIHEYKLTTMDLTEIENLIQQKYSTWEWNFGYSPKYEFTNEYQDKGTKYSCKVKVQEGRITFIELTSGRKNPFAGKLLNEILIGQKHNYKDLEKLLNLSSLRFESLGLNSNILLRLLF